MSNSDGESHNYFPGNRLMKNRPASPESGQAMQSPQKSNFQEAQFQMPQSQMPQFQMSQPQMQGPSVQQDKLTKKEIDLARQLMEQDKFQDALQIYKKHFDHPMINKESITFRILACLNNMGLEYAEKKDGDNALKCYREALQYEPKSSQIWNNIGNLYKNLHEYDKAIKAYRLAVAYNTSNALAFCNLGHAYHCTGKYYAELVCYDEALRIDPNHALTHWNRALCLLLFERYKEGFEEYEWRFKNKQFFDVDEKFYQNLWKGEALPEDKTLIVYTEQGFGDCIQYLRFLPEVKKRAKCKIIFSCKQTFHRMCEYLDCVDKIADIQKAESVYDYHVPLLSLPYIFDITLDNLPAECPYIFPNKDLVKEWQSKLKNNKRLKIAICWGGSPTNKLDHTRSFSFETLLPLINIKEIDWYSVQVDRSPDIDMSSYDNFIDYGPEIKDFADTAAVLKTMDMLITVETAVAHLAGALNIPCWIYISTYPAWRWHLHREDNQWYPSVRLFRQVDPGDWDEVTERIVAELKKKYKRRLNK